MPWYVVRSKVPDVVRVSKSRSKRNSSTRHLPGGGRCASCPADAVSLVFLTLSRYLRIFDEDIVARVR